MDSLGRLIQRARQLNGGMTQAQAARAAGFKSKTYWSQIEAGIRVPPADTAARMARVVHLTPAQLRKAGHEEAADELAEILDIFGPYVGDSGDMELVSRIKALSEEERKALFVLLKVLPSAIPAALVAYFGWWRRSRTVRIATAGAGAAAVAGLVVAVWPSQDGPTGNGPGARPKPGVAAPTRPRRPSLPTRSIVPTDRETPLGPTWPERDGPGDTGEEAGAAPTPSPSPTPPGEAETPWPGDGLDDDEPGRDSPKCTISVVVRPLVGVCVRLPLGQGLGTQG